ncbi:MAG: phycobilisome rod-core linker polypeptide [Limnospira sp. PMC 1291.21]|uniref:Phycobilisome linker polypeptide n=3 Tax=Limnospira TaxID=2596745 RepID=A0A9P1KCV9_9CYAN|nr:MULTISPECIES: phycobilisome rod-core linker polypeptide [Limnospira]EKD10758.1 phycobilisome linker polypeptide [Arthrospira platensis C1]MDC0840488.1 phycobilisome rod-core linker polypeptide [Limnoraphis robusta]MDY7054496.1 phycobilisome rod-core linker polypeptide [Limnospira fusiformis LS22]QJB28129.1 phycobilisome linker polypeptide [Limnospira fusiformis SAG 85.79]RAQ44311.1 phycobilisome linker polypeptide [Arthrospira sp. O9.13F]
MPLHETITTTHNASVEERTFVLSKIYQQVLERQPYESERKQLWDLERDFKKGKLGIRHFLKSLVVRPVYLEHFYENSSNLKFIENACKHFLGRTPHGDEEIHHWDNILLRHGVGALVSDMVDSEEYRKCFGYFTVPYWREQALYQSATEYLENERLGHEHPGQRGWGIPNHYQQKLHINSDSESEVAKTEPTPPQEDPQPSPTALGMMNETEAEKIMECIQTISKILFDNRIPEQRISRKRMENAIRQQVLEFMTPEDAVLLGE